MKKLIRPIAKWLAIAVGFLLLLAAVIGPFFVPFRPLEDVGSAQAAATSESQFVTIPFTGTDGIEIHYLADVPQDNQEPTFVLLHGSVYNAFTWNQVIDFFDERGRVIAYDQIPYGLSEKLVAGDWSGPNPTRSTRRLRSSSPCSIHLAWKRRFWLATLWRGVGNTGGNRTPRTCRRAHLR
ncbi:MAG: hypothetical protein R3E79_07810 [Caldilineaceae bacterium]